MVTDRKGFTPVEFKADDAAGTFSATFATLNVIDKDGDVTLPGAFKDGQEVRIAQWGHNWSGLVVGKGVIHADDERAWVDGQFFLDTDHGVQTYRTVKNLGALQEWSYGFAVEEADFGTFQGREVRFLKRLDVFEVSPVMLGAGVGTRTDAIKGAAALSLADHSELFTELAGDLAARFKARADLRAKEGRELSAANVERLTAHRDTLRGLAADLDALVEANRKGDEQQAAALAAVIETELILARQLGVEV